MCKTKLSVLTKTRSVSWPEQVGLQAICCDSSVRTANLDLVAWLPHCMHLGDVVLATPAVTLKGTSAAQEGNDARLLPLRNYGCQSTTPSRCRHTPWLS